MIRTIRVGQCCLGQVRIPKIRPAKLRAAEVTAFERDLSCLDRVQIAVPQVAFDEMRRTKRCAASTSVREVAGGESCIVETCAAEIRPVETRTLRLNLGQVGKGFAF